MAIPYAKSPAERGEMPFRFFLPRNISYGVGALKRLEGLKANRALIVTDRGVMQAGISGRVEETLRQRCREVETFDEVVSNPSIDVVRKGAKLALDFQPDLLIAVGGGSPMDVCKGIKIFYEHPHLMTARWFEVVQKARGLKFERQLTCVFVPTTSGSGSEVSSVVIFTDTSLAPHVKIPVASLGLIPDVAIVDPELTLSMPRDLTAITGYDALVHALEAYLVYPDSELINALSLMAVQLVFPWLPKAVADGRDLVARDKMHTASMISGLATGNGKLGFLHSAAHQLGGAFNTIHGQTVAVLTCPTMAHFYPSLMGRMAEIARAIGIQGAQSDSDAAKQLVAALDRLRKGIGLPSSFKEMGVDRREFERLLDILVQNAIEASVAAPIPSFKEGRDIFLQAWEGSSSRICG